MNIVYLLLGGNLGNSKKIFKHAIQMLGITVGPVSHSSSLYESQPWGFKHKNNFINQALGSTSVPIQILNACLLVKQQLEGKIKSR